MALETTVILKLIYLQLKKSGNIDEAIGAVSQLLSKEEVAALNNEVEEWLKNNKSGGNK
jgi:hypothetical protein